MGKRGDKVKQYLKRYSDENPEKFNKEFILSRDRQDILECVKDVFKALEILDEVKVEEVSLDKDEASFGPIKAQHAYYKSILPSRLDKIHYRVRITPSESTELSQIELGSNERKEVIGESFIKEGDIFINKLVDDCFYINEGVRYFLIYQIVDNSTYGTEDCVSLKSLLMPITLRQHIITAVPELMEDPIDIKSFETLLFSKRVNPLLYTFGKDAYNSLVGMEVKDKENIISEWQGYKDPTLITKFNEFFKTDFKFSDNLNKLIEDGRLIFKIKQDKSKEEGCYVSVNKEDLKSNLLTQAVLGSLLDMKNETKKKRIVFSYDDLITPWFWIDKLSTFFTKNSDAGKKFNKIRTMLISLNRLMDDTTRKILNLKDDDKENTLTIIRYIMGNFDELMNADSQDLCGKRLRLYEYQLYPLRKYFSDQIYRVLNSPTRSKTVLDRIFSNLSPMFIIRQTVTNELLRYYNATNDMNLFSAFLKYTFRGPQSLSKTVSMNQRDLHPSYAGRLSLIAASASDPGLSGSLCPFLQEYDYYFEKQKN